MIRAKKYIMTEVKINDTTVQLYSSIKELPIERSKKFNHYILQDVGIGNKMEDVDDHLARIMVFMSNDKKTEALEELKNLRFNLFSMVSEWNYSSTAFGYLIKSVNGKAVDLDSPESVTALIAELSGKGLTEEMVESSIEEVKKNLLPKGDFTSRNSLLMMPTI